MITTTIRYNIIVLLTLILGIIAFGITPEEKLISGTWHSDRLKTLLRLDLSLNYALTFRKNNRETVITGFWRAKENYLYLEARKLETKGIIHEYYKTLIYQYRLSHSHLVLINRYDLSEIFFIR